MKKKYLIITYFKDSYFFPFLESESIKICEPFKSRDFIHRFLFRLPILSTLSYGFKNELKDVDKVVIFDSAYNYWLGYYLNKRFLKEIPSIKEDNIKENSWREIHEIKRIIRL